MTPRRPFPSSGSPSSSSSSSGSSSSKRIFDGLAQHGIDPRVGLVLEEFVTLFETWNRSINLSAARTRDAIADHVVDSLAVVPHLLAAHELVTSQASEPATSKLASSSDSSQPSAPSQQPGSSSVSSRSLRILDVGSGGGFPVVIAAACIPTADLVSLEPVHKKHAFLRTAARTLSLTNLEAFAERIEDHADDSYDVAMSRATFELGEWLTLGATKVRRGGIVLGFEAIPVELSPGVDRFPYVFLDRTRSIVVRRVI